MFPRCELLGVCPPGGWLRSRPMASKWDYLDHLARVPFFSGCSKKDLKEIAKAADELPIKAGTTLIDQGQAGREAFIVLGRHRDGETKRQEGRDPRPRCGHR